MRGALDRAFLRRIRFVIAFPFPDAAAREAIWRRQLPPEAPTGAVDLAGLARLNLSGGNIRSVALAAAFKAADHWPPTNPLTRAYVLVDAPSGKGALVL